MNKLLKEQPVEEYSSRLGDEPGASEQQLLNRTAEACHHVTTLHEFKTLIRTHVRQLFPHQSAVCGIGEIQARRVLRLVNIDYPESYLRGIISPDQTIRSCLLDAWLRQRVPILITPDDVKMEPPSTWLQLARQHRLETIAAHGLIESSGHTFSFFAFANLSLASSESHARLLRELVPHLYAALSCALTAGYLKTIEGVSDGPRSGATEPGRITAPKAKNPSLTRREDEILIWVCQGKTNWEIARILNLSEHTVKNHVRNILKKLGVVNRVQAAGNSVR